MKGGSEKEIEGEWEKVGKKIGHERGEVKGRGGNRGSGKVVRGGGKEGEGKKFVNVNTVSNRLIGRPKTKSFGSKHMFAMGGQLGDKEIERADVTVSLTIGRLEGGEVAWSSLKIELKSVRDLD